jgi:hypothetical protein
MQHLAAVARADRILRRTVDGYLQAELGRLAACIRANGCPKARLPIPRTDEGEKKLPPLRRLLPGLMLFMWCSNQIRYQCFGLK